MVSSIPSGWLQNWLQKTEHKSVWVAGFVVPFGTSSSPNPTEKAAIQSLPFARLFELFIGTPHCSGSTNELEV